MEMPKDSPSVAKQAAEKSLNSEREWRKASLSG